MKKEKVLQILLQIATDGDFDLKNEDGYFEESFESYSKILFLKDFADENKIKDELENLFKNLKERAYTKNNRKQGLVDYIKDIDFHFESYNSSNRIDSVKVFPYILTSFRNKFTYISGNQDISLYLNRVTINNLENEDEKNEYEQYLRLKAKYESLNITI